MKITLTILVLIFSINAVAHNKVAVIPLIENAPPGTVYVKSNGVKIGVHLEGTSTFTALSKNEYVFSVEGYTGKLEQRNLYFTSDDCTGSAYTFGVGRVFSSHENQELVYYTKTNATIEQVAIGSVLTYGEVPPYYLDYGVICRYYGSSAPQPAKPVYPNDPAVTGVQDSYTLPITIGF